MPRSHRNNRQYTKGIVPTTQCNTMSQLELNYKGTQSLLRRVNANVCKVHSRVRGHMVGGSKVKIKPEHLAYIIIG